jgi:parvulin-like peptidyl-prolyl isomerase
MRAARPIALLAAATAGVVALAGCGTGGEATQPAATVDGVEISQQAVVDELEAVRGNQAYVDALQAADPDTGAPGLAVLGTEDGTFDNAYVNTILANQILYQFVLNEVEERGLEVTEQCETAARDLEIRRLDQASTTGTDGETLFEGFGEDYQRTLLARDGALLALEADLMGYDCGDPEADQRYFEEHEDDFTQVCASHILLDTEDEALEVKQELEAGADFALTAAARSTDTSAQGPPGQPGSGGDLGCFDSQSGFVAEFTDAALALPVGELSDPVQTQFGFHIILVTSREVPDFEDVQDDVAAALSSAVNDAINEFISARIQTGVTVDPRYGTWNTTTGRIDRPAAASPTTAPVVPDPSGG